ncbi:MAG TPA: pyridoxal-phosphate dependent enzyme [Flavitalea sp.]|nr:pyridoxal-phosphate dependent enzyme [Flavitalea sp.]
MYEAAEQIVSLPDAGLQKLNHPIADQFGIEVDVLRLDKIHPVISGNKFFKLRYFLKEARRENKSIVTFGGAWSNHLLATAYICKQLQIPCTGLIRGERPTILSASLVNCESWGMTLMFMSRNDFRDKLVPPVIQNNAVIIPEGGASETGVRGAATILNHLEVTEYSEIICGVGTGTMMAGLLQQSSTMIRGVSALKIATEARHSFEHLLRKHAGDKQFDVDYRFHFGGYAKHPPELLQFMNEFFEETGIQTDIVYTGKLFYGLMQIIKEGGFQPGTKICAIHSGGIQGNRSLRPGMLVWDEGRRWGSKDEVED